MAETLLQAIGLGRRVPGGGPWLLRDIDLSLAAGERVGVIGPSGAGKSLLLRSLAMLDPCDHGQVRWRGQPVRGSEVPRFRRHVTYMHQRPPLLEGTVEDNLRYPYRLKMHRGREFDGDRVERWLKHLGRDASFFSKKDSDLSGGEGQIVALLRAVQLDPDVLLLDEPTAALDQATTAAVEELVQLWFDEAPATRSTVWVSHDREQVSRVAARQWRITAGRLLCH